MSISIMIRDEAARIMSKIRCRKDEVRLSRDRKCAFRYSWTVIVEKPFTDVREAM